MHIRSRKSIVAISLFIGILIGSFPNIPDLRASATSQNETRTEAREKRSAIREEMKKLRNSVLAQKIEYKRAERSRSDTKPSNEIRTDEDETKETSKSEDTANEEKRDTAVKDASDEARGEDTVQETVKPKPDSKEMETPEKQVTPKDTSPSAPSPVKSEKPADKKPSSGETDDTRILAPADFKTALERNIHSLTNEKRRAAGVSPLATDSDLAKTARAHSADMAANNFFSHTNLAGCSPSCRLQKAGYAYSAMGENIAWISGSALDADILAKKFVTNWMNSDGHRKNMLSPNFTHEGIGIAVIGNKVYATANFSKPRE